MNARANWIVVLVSAMIAFGAFAGAFAYMQRLNSDYARLEHLTFGDLLQDVEEVERAALLLRQTITEIPQSDLVAGLAADVAASPLSSQLAATVDFLGELVGHSDHEDFAARYGQHASFAELLSQLEGWQRDLEAGNLSEASIREMERALSSLAGSLNGLSLIVMERTSLLSDQISDEIEMLMVLGITGLLALLLGGGLLLRLQRKTDRRMIQAERTGEQLVGALNTLGHGFAYFDSEDRLVLYNDWYRRAFNLPVEQGMTFEETIRIGLKHGLYSAPGDKDEAWIAERLQAHRQPQGPIQMQFGNGRWVQIEERPTGDGGRAGIRIDITDWKMREANLTTELHQRAAFLSALRSATSLPSAVLEKMLNLASQEKDAERAKAYLETGFQAQSLISRMIDDLPILAEPKRGKLGLVAVEFETSRLWQTPMAFLGSGAETSGVTLSPKPDSNLPERLKGDVTRLLQVIMMLLDHALAEARGGQISLSYSLAVPRGSASSSLLLRCEIGLSDRAPSRERWSALLNLSSDNHLTENAGESGLILARRLAEAMGGRLHLDDGFLFEAPVSRIPMPLSFLARDSERPQIERGVLRFEGNPSVLVVEDDRINRRLILAYLERMGVRGVSVDDGVAAVERATNERFDLILMDIVLPRLDGLGTTEAIRNGDGACRDAPILALTANAKPIDVEHCLSAGMNGHIAKPVDPVRLMQAMQRWMKVVRDDEETEIRTNGPDFEDPLDASALDDLVAGAGGALATELIGDFLTDLEGRMEVLRLAAKEMDSATLVKVCHSIKGSAGLFGASELADLAAQIEEEANHLTRGEAFRLVSELSAASDRSRDAYGCWQTQHGTGLDAIQTERDDPSNIDRSPPEANDRA